MDIKALERVDMERFLEWLSSKLPRTAANNTIKIIVRHDNDYRLMYARFINGDWKYTNNLKQMESMSVLFGVENGSITTIRQHYIPKFINAEIPWGDPLDR